MFRLLLILSLSIATAQSIPADAVGVLSFIEDLPDVGAMAEDPRRSLPFIEVIAVTPFQECLEVNFDPESPRCDQFEWSLNYFTRDALEDYEEDLVRAWMRFEIRSYLRARMEIGMAFDWPYPSYPRVCRDGYYVREWEIFTGEDTFPGADFCDGVSLNPPCGSSCGSFDNTCGDFAACTSCMIQGLALAAVKMAQYYAEYLLDVSLALAKHFPTALWWEDPLTGSGAVMVPLADYTVVLPSKLLEKLDEYARETGNPLASTYYLATGAENLTCLPYQHSSITDLLLSIPGYAYDEDNPGVRELEDGKLGLASRQSAGEMWRRFGSGSKEDMLPGTYDREWGREPYDTLSAPLTYSCFGYTQAFFSYAELETILHWHRPYFRMDRCLLPPPSIWPFAAQPVPGGFWTFSGNIIHTDLTTISEGYEIPYVEGLPRW